MSKFSHISSVKDIDSEISKTELKKRIIKEDLALKARSAKELLKPATLGWQLVRMFLSKNDSSTPASILIKTATEFITTIEASKYSFKLLKKIFS